MTNLPPNFYLINKPINWTSFDVVGFIRKKIKNLKSPEAKQTENAVTYHNKDAEGEYFFRSERSPAGDSSASKKKMFHRERPLNKQPKIRVGHAGTLDPFATGLLIVGVGRDATRALDQFKNLPKTYRATIFLGATSTTGDPTGEITRTREHENIKTNSGQNAEGVALGDHRERPSDTRIAEVLKSFLGKQTQIPPMHSAKSVGGVRLYKLAREGKTVERQPNEIEILDIKLLSYSYPELSIETTVSPGTYIRTLAEDIGAKLGCGAYCLALERTAIGPYKLSNAISPEDFIPIDHQNCKE